MAEFVELRLEQMLPELEHLKKIELFTQEEVKSIIKKRREFEYKLQKKSKRKEDIMRYIQYEVDLLSMLDLRRKRLGNFNRKTEIDMAIATRINKLFMFATSRFPNDLKTWMSHIEFCKKMKWKHSVSRVFVRLLALNNNDPSIWILAAKWEFEENDSASNGRGLLLRALRFHPGNIQIYKEAFRLELLEAERLRKRSKEMGLSCEADLPESESKRQSILDGDLAKAFYEDAKNHSKSASDLLPFLIVAKDFDYTKTIQEKIINDMKEEYGNDEITWDTIARNVLEKTPETASLKINDRIDMCCADYEDAIKRLDTPRMWQFYFETLLYLHENEAIRYSVRKRLYDVFQRGLKAKRLVEDHVIDWMAIVEKDPLASDQLKPSLDEALKQFPKSVTLWNKLLVLTLEGKEEVPLFQIDTGSNSGDGPEAMETSQNAEIPDVFWEAIKSVGEAEDSIVLWQTAIDHFTAHPNKEEAIPVVDKLYEKAMASELSLCNRFKPQYLLWLLKAKGLEAARQYYKKNANVPPLLIDFHMNMLSAEMDRKKQVDVKSIREIYEKAVFQFGQKNSDLWLKYIQFETDSGDPLKVGDIYNRAKMTLEPNAADEFITKHTELRLKA